MKILYLDIETAPNVADLWSLWGYQNVSLNQLRQSSYMLCWAAKWHGDRSTMFCREKGMVEIIHNLLSEADVVVTYNGDKFDLPTLNKEFILTGLGPPSPYRSVDLYKTVKRVFRFPSNKLAYVAPALGVGEKVEHEGHTLWTKVIAGDEKAWKKMESYCKKDTALLEPLHDVLLPWIPNYPNRLLYDSGGWCPKCGSGVVVKEGYRYLTTGKYQQYHCGSCGGWFRDTKRIEGVEIQ